MDRGVLEGTNMSEVSKADPHGCDNGALTDRFGVLIQGLLAVVAFSTLMGRFLFLKTAEQQLFLADARDEAVSDLREAAPGRRSVHVGFC